MKLEYFSRFHMKIWEFLDESMWKKSYQLSDIFAGGTLLFFLLRLTPNLFFMFFFLSLMA